MKATHTLGPLERSVLKIIWNKQRASVQDVLGELNKIPEHKALAYTTVMTILTRLVEKKVLSREKEGRCFYYTPQQRKPEFVRDMVKKTIQSMVLKFGDEAVTAFLAEAKQLSNQEKAQLISQIHTKQDD